MNVLTSITFFDIAVALVVTGCLERLVLRFAPPWAVGPRGWLLRIEAE